MTEVQVFEGEGGDKFRISQMLSNLVLDMKRTGDLSRFKPILLELVELGHARRNERDETIVTFPGDQVVTYPSSLIGPPPNGSQVEWKLRSSDPPKYFGCYWIRVRQEKTPFVAEFDTKGWKYPDGKETGDPFQDTKGKPINSKNIIAWKPRWGAT